jgi:hypothetical protein
MVDRVRKGYMPEMARTISFVEITCCATMSAVSRISVRRLAKERPESKIIETALGWMAEVVEYGGIDDLLDRDRLDIFCAVESKIDRGNLCAYGRRYIHLGLLPSLYPILLHSTSSLMVCQGENFRSGEDHKNFSGDLHMLSEQPL